MDRLSSLNPKLMKNRNCKEINSRVSKPRQYTPAAKPTAKSIEPSLADLLNNDNSFLFNLDLDGLEDFPKNNKRPFDEDSTKPEVSKKIKISSPTLKQITLDDSVLNSSQLLLKGLDLDSTQLTQAGECIEDLMDDDDFIPVIINPVTCSQYIQLKHEASNDKLELFDYAQPKESIAEEFVAGRDTLIPSQNREYLAALGINSDVFNQVHEGIINKKNEDEGSAAAQKMYRPKSYRPSLLPVSSGGFKELGPFFGLANRHKNFILSTKNIQSLYDWQEECLNLPAIHNRCNLIYALPTSGGKTLVAEIAMLREIMLRKKNVIFVLPYVSIVQEKVHDLLPFAVEFNFLVEEYCAGKGAIPPEKRRRKNTIYIATIEKSQIMFDSLFELNRLSEIGLIVVDELHMVGDPHRGFALETLLAKATFQKQTHIQVIGMSATISNLHEVARFLKADVYTRDFRPVELKEYLKIGTDLFSINPKARYVGEAFKLEKSSFSDNYSDRLKKRDPDHVTGLVMEVTPRSSCLIFCATKQYCENTAKLLMETMPRIVLSVRQDEKKALIESIKADSNGRMCPVLAKTIPFGVAYHHSGLTSDERKHLEEAFRLSIITVICCTSTLAAGVNLPAQRVIIRSPYIGSSFLTLTRYKQMVGRAGRAGHCESGESILICDPKDNEKMVNLLCSKMDETVSGFVQDESGRLVRTIVLNLIGTKLAHCVDDLVVFFKCSLLAEQIERTDGDLRAKMVKSAKELMIEGALSYRTATSGLRHPSFTIKLNGEDQTVYPDDILSVSMLGMAAVNAGLSLEDAQKIEADLLKAQKNLVLEQRLHMLFIVAPNESVDSINFDNALYNTILMNLQPTLMNTMRIVGISESLAMRIITKPRSIKEDERLLLKRFYIALMLFEMWNGKDVHEVGLRFKVDRGIAYNLLNLASSKAYSIFKFCEIYKDFEVFKDLLEKFSKQLAYCCSTELLPLMELPAVKLGRAKLLFAAGYKTIDDIACATPEELCSKVKNVNSRQASQIIKAATHAVAEVMETMVDRLSEMKDKMKAKKQADRA